MALIHYKGIYAKILKTLGIMQSPESKSMMVASAMVSDSGSNLLSPVDLRRLLTHNSSLSSASSTRPKTAPSNVKNKSGKNSFKSSKARPSTSGKQRSGKLTPAKDLRNRPPSSNSPSHYSYEDYGDNRGDGRQ